VVVEFHFFEPPGFAHAQAMAGLVFDKEGVVLGGGDANAAIMAGVLRLAINRQHRHDRSLRIRRQKGAYMQHGAKRNVAQIRRCAQIAHDAIRQQGEGMRVITVKLARSRHAETAAPVRVIDEDEFATVGMRFLQRRKLSGLGAECICCRRVALRSCFVCGDSGGKQDNAETQCQEEARERHRSAGVMKL